MAMKQATLSFGRISAEEAAQQSVRLALELAAQPSVPKPVKRPVGRPLKRPLQLDEVLQREDTEPEAGTAAAAAHNKKQRGGYTNWFAHPALVRDIVSAFRRSSSARAAVDLLRRSHPDGGFDRLSHSSLVGWFDDKRNLLPKYEALLASGEPAARGRGRPSTFSLRVDIEEEITATLQRLRGAGTPLNTRLIGWIMRSIIETKQPVLLQQLTLSRSFISKWLRQTLQWSWRARTTAASKLPLDWEAQGEKMAMRIAAKMQMDSVSMSPTSTASAPGLQLLALVHLLTPCPLLCCADLPDPSLTCCQHGSDRCASRSFLSLDLCRSRLLQHRRHRC